MDPLARMQLHSDSFRAMTEQVQQAADRLCGGKLVMVHEGGYADTSRSHCCAILSFIARFLSFR